MTIIFVKFLMYIIWNKKHFKINFFHKDRIFFSSKPSFPLLLYCKLFRNKFLSCYLPVQHLVWCRPTTVWSTLWINSLQGEVSDEQIREHLSQSVQWYVFNTIQLIAKVQIGIFFLSLHTKDWRASSVENLFQISSHSYVCTYTAAVVHGLEKILLFLCSVWHTPVEEALIRVSDDLILKISCLSGFIWGELLYMLKWVVKAKELRHLSQNEFILYGATAWDRERFSLCQAWPVSYFLIEFYLMLSGPLSNLSEFLFFSSVRTLCSHKVKNQTPFSQPVPPPTHLLLCSWKR